MYTAMSSGCAENERNVGKMSSPLTRTNKLSSALGKLVNYVDWRVREREREGGRGEEDWKKERERGRWRERDKRIQKSLIMIKRNQNKAFNYITPRTYSLIVGLKHHKATDSEGKKENGCTKQELQQIWECFIKSSSQCLKGQRNYKT